MKSVNCDRSLRMICRHPPPLPPPHRPSKPRWFSGAAVSPGAPLSQKKCFFFFLSISKQVKLYLKVHFTNMSSVLPTEIKGQYTGRLTKMFYKGKPTFLIGEI